MPQIIFFLKGPVDILLRAFERPVFYFRVSPVLPRWVGIVGSSGRKEENTRASAYWEPKN